jgi:hypothetical protein
MVVMLGKQQIQARNMVVGTIIAPGGRLKDTFTLPANGMVEVVSKERIELPDDVCAYAFVRTTLCNQGVLAINIGIIDPGWKGLVSSTLINFGREEVKIAPGETFLRITFHEFQRGTGTFQAPTPPTDVAYIKDAKTKAITTLSPTFLDVHATAKEAAEQVFGTWGKRISVFLGFVGLIALFFTILNLYLSFLGQHRLSLGESSRYVEDRRALDQRLGSIEATLKEIGRQGDRRGEVLDAGAPTKPDVGTLSNPDAGAPPKKSP